MIAGFILLVAITFAIPNKTEVQKQFTYITTYIWADVDEHTLGRGPALHRRRAPSSSASRRASRRARGCCSRSRATAQCPGIRHGGKVSRHRVPVWPCRASPCAGFLLMLPTWWNNLAGYYVGTSVGTTGALHRVHPAGDPALRQGDKLRAGAWSLGSHYKWINPIAIIWVAFISIVFMLPTGPGGHPVASRASTGTSRTTRR